MAMSVHYGCRTCSGGAPAPRAQPSLPDVFLSLEAFKKPQDPAVPVLGLLWAEWCPHCHAFIETVKRTKGSPKTASCFALEARGDPLRPLARLP